MAFQFGLFLLLTLVICLNVGSVVSDDGECGLVLFFFFFKVLRFFFVCVWNGVSLTYHECGGRR